MREIKIRVQDEYALVSDDFAGVQGAGNVTMAVIEFDEGWKGYQKSALWLSSLGKSLTRVRLTEENRVAGKDETYRVLVPYEALQEAGECTLMIEGGGENAVARSVQVPLRVEPAFDTGDAQDPQRLTPSEADQLSAVIEGLGAEIDEINARGIIIGATLTREE